MPSTHTLRVLDAATSFAVDIDRLIETSRPRLIDAAQLRAAANSIGANIAEAYGREAGPDRLHFFRIARGSAEEALQHLRVNYRANRISTPTFRSLNNLGIIIIRMIDGLIRNAIGRREGR